MDRPSTHKINEESVALNDTLDQMDLIPTEHLTPEQQAIHPFQMIMECFLEYTTC